MTAKGQYFDQFLRKKYETDFLPLFDKFLEAVFNIAYIHLTVVLILTIIQ